MINKENKEQSRKLYRNQKYNGNFFVTAEREELGMSDIE